MRKTCSLDMKVEYDNFIYSDSFCTLDEYFNYKILVECIMYCLL